MKQILCFHLSNEPYGFLSNWYFSSFCLNGILYHSMEQYMMYQKAVLFDDLETASRILETDDFAEMKALGRKVSNYQEVVWNGMRQIIVYNGLLAKFSQNEDLKNQLIQTGDAVLAECAVKDRIWATGLSMQDPDRLDMYKWKGQNLLGFALMLVRQQLAAAGNCKSGKSEID